MEELERYLAIIKGKGRISELKAFMPDWRCYLLAEKLDELNKCIRRIEYYINPPVIVRQVLTEPDLALALKNYYSSRSERILSSINSLIESVLAVLGTLLQTEYVVVERTNLPESLRDFFSTFINLVQRLQEEIISIANLPYEYPQALKSTSSIHQRWADIKLLLSHRLIFPLKTSINNIAKREVTSILRGLM